MNKKRIYKYVAIVALILLMSFAGAQIVINEEPTVLTKEVNDTITIDDDCYRIIEYGPEINQSSVDWVEKICVRNKTSKEDNCEDFIHYNFTMVNKTTITVKCDEIVKFGDKEIDYETQGYACSENQTHLVCDNVRDGNGDGICQDGETCCIVNLAKEVNCKNGGGEWNNKMMNEEKLNAR